MKTKKRLVLPVAMLLALLMVAAALSGLGVFLGNGTIYAADATFDTAKAVSVSGATVTAGSDQSGSVTHKGLLISPETSTGEYSGTINALLPANSTIQFSFPGTLISDGGNHNARQLDFTFRFTSVSNPDEWFEVYFFNVGWNGWYNKAAVRDSDGNLRTADQHGKYYGADKLTGENPHYPYYGSNDNVSGMIETYVDSSGVLGIVVPMKAEEEVWNCVLAKFDSDEYTEVDNDNGICGLKKIDFSAGYTVSFSAKSKNEEATAPLLIEKINDQSFETATFEAEPSWYTDYADIPQISISGRVEKEYTTEDPLVIPSATFTYPIRGTETFDVAKIELQKDGGEWATVSAGDTVSAAGNYTLRYTAVDGGTSAGNTVEKMFSVYKDYFDLSEIVDVTGGTVTPGADKSGEVKHEGVIIEAETKKGEYGGTINGVFKGNSKIDFNFPGILNDNGSSPSIDFMFRFTDVNAPDNYFDIIFFNDGWSGWFTAMAVRDKDGNIRTTRYSGDTLTIFDATTSNDDDDSLNNLPYSGGSNSSSGYIDLQWSGNVLEVYVLNAKGLRYCLAKFDSDEYSAFDNTSMVYGLKKVAFPDGYTVSFTSKSKGDNATVPLLIEQINGVSLANKWFGPEYMTYKDMEYVSGSDSIEIIATRDQKTPEELGLGVRFNYTVTLGTLTLNGKKIAYPEETVDLTTENTASVTYSFLTETVNRTVKVIDTPPILTLDGIADETGYRLGGPNESQMSLLKSDISAVDLLDGTIDADKITIYMKKPGQSEFTAVSEGKFSPDTIGTYEIKYVASDSTGKESEIVRRIRVVDSELPVITVNGTIPEKSTVGAVLTLPDATATDNGVALDTLMVKAYCNNEEITVENGKVTFAKAGVYKIVYYAVDPDGNESMTEYEINVPKDEGKPIIEEVTIPETIKLGTEITIPQMSATDEVDGTVVVMIKVCYGKDEVPLTNRTFTASKEGVYSVVCTATDKAGNTAERVYEITVLQNIPDPENPAKGDDNKPNTVIIVCAAVGAVILAGGAAAAVIIIKKRRIK